MAVIFQSLLRWLKERDFNFLNNEVLLFELVVLLFSCDVFPTNNWKTIDAVNILNGIMAANEVFLSNVALQNVDDIGGE